jgi:hypothetical protein
LKKGDIYTVPEETGLTLSTGNAGGLVFTVDGQGGVMIGERAEIMRKVDISPDVLKVTGKVNPEAATVAAALIKQQTPAFSAVPAVMPVAPATTPRVVKKKAPPREPYPPVIRTPN